MWEVDYKEGWVPQRINSFKLVLEKTLESPLDYKETQPVHPKGDQSWVFTGRTDAEVETPILWSPDVKSWLIGKDPDAGKDWGQEKGATQDEMVDWHHRLSRHESEQTLADNKGQGRPGVLQSMQSQRVGQDWAIELNWNYSKDWSISNVYKMKFYEDVQYLIKFSILTFYIKSFRKCFKIFKIDNVTL